MVWSPILIRVSESRSWEKNVTEYNYHYNNTCILAWYLFVGAAVAERSGNTPGGVGTRTHAQDTLLRFF